MRGRNAFARRLLQLSEYKILIDGSAALLPRGEGSAPLRSHDLAHDRDDFSIHASPNDEVASLASFLPSCIGNASNIMAGVRRVEGSRQWRRCEWRSGQVLLSKT
jgi:hypothetical protein